MMKKVFILLAFVAGAMCVNAQDVFQKGSFVLQAGVGAGSLTWGGDGSQGSEGCAAFTASGEFGLVDGLIGGDSGAIGLGGTIGYGGKSWSGIKLNNFLVAAIGTFHYQFIPNLDTYGMVTLGLNFQKWEWNGWGGILGGDSSLSNTAFQPEFHVGARYFFTDSFAVMAEAGYGLSIFQAGIAFKF